MSLKQLLSNPMDSRIAGLPVRHGESSVQKPGPLGWRLKTGDYKHSGRGPQTREARKLALLVERLCKASVDPFASDTLTQNTSIPPATPGPVLPSV